MDILQSTFEKHKELMLERVDADKFVTKEQCEALDRLFVIIRNALKDIKEYSGNKSFKDYKPVDRDIEVVDKETIKVYIPKYITSKLPRLKDSLLIKVVDKKHKAMDGGKKAIASASIEIIKNNVKSIYFRKDILTGKLENLECAIQHELQHITHSAKMLGLNTDGDKLSSTIAYLGDDAEILAFCREYAFRYKKNYPDDKSVDMSKMKKILTGDEEVMKIYLEFESPSPSFIKKHSPSEKEKKEMKNIYSRFTKMLNKYLKCFI